MATTNSALLLDVGAIAAASVAVCLFADRPVLMGALIPTLMATRLAVWARLPGPSRRHGLPLELAALLSCTVLGGLNDWMSVVRHRVYDYTVPVLVPELGSIPLWMLLYWGQILRSLATLCAWRGLGPSPGEPRDQGLIRAPGLRLLVLLGLVLVTRQCIYRWYAEPLLSWLPFSLALIVYGVALGVGRPELRLAALIASVGPLVEIGYIQLGGLHRYHLGWLAGVPIWLVLWWVLGTLGWREVTTLVGQRGDPDGSVRPRASDT